MLDRRIVGYRCVTSDGKHGAVTFHAGDAGAVESLPENPHQLAAGVLFLVNTRGGKITIRQLNPDLSGISNSTEGLAEGVAKVKALAESNETVKAFLAGRR